ncbi:response regulator [uncultured Arcobacter sp.]|uniref:response regulator n=1 Tax=uncultured Arcobacter sp. TaxID=165434 RepID=UPI002606A650|nr:response regulator [uncultured Arcobacter sp.]
MMSAILCVDDEDIILRSLSQDLSRQFKDYTIELAQNAEDALEILDELSSEGVKVLVIVSDWLMPGMKGDEFLIEAHKKFPKVIKILLTGQADEKAIKNAQLNADLKCTFSKPWESSELVSKIKEEIGKLDE